MSRIKFPPKPSSNKIHQSLANILDFVSMESLNALRLKLKSADLSTNLSAKVLTKVEAIKSVLRPRTNVRGIL